MKLFKLEWRANDLGPAEQIYVVSKTSDKVLEKYGKIGRLLAKDDEVDILG